MSTEPLDLASALAGSRDQLGFLGQQVTLAKTGFHGSGSAPTAALARAAVFTDALLGIVRARLAEMKTVLR